MFPMPFADDPLFYRPTEPERPSADPDKRLACLVSQRLARVVPEQTRRVKVEVQNRVVLLDGPVDSAATAAAVGGLAWDVPGVVDVRNSLTWPHRASGR